MIHWLQYDSVISDMDMAEIRLKELCRYLKENPTAKATGYRKTVGDMFAKFIRLECDQNYQDLDIHCNSMSDKCLKHFDKKPCNLEYSEYVTDVINQTLSTQSAV